MGKSTSTQRRHVSILTVGILTFFIVMLTHTTLTLSLESEREINRNIRIQLAALKSETERIYEAIICSYKFDAVDVLDCCSEYISRMREHVNAIDGDVNKLIKIYKKANNTEGLALAGMMATGVNKMKEGIGNLVRSEDSFIAHTALRDIHNAILTMQKCCN
ncbi:MAG: hypothetical protein GTO08_05855 [Deltaproteobacteria bacterium]|nr:hypothetical protein [Deltaproteobacteria bacterium]